MTYTIFKNEVAQYMQRAASAFVNPDTSLDLLDRAIHQARRWAERQRDFEMLRVEAELASVHYTDGGDLADAVLKGTATPVAVKTIKRAFLPYSNGSGTFPIDIVTRDKHIARVQRNYERWSSTDPAANTTPVADLWFQLVRMGDKVYLSPASVDALGGETITLYMDVVKWSEDYSASSTDFFLDYCEDFMLYRSVFQLNMMLKEDQRVPISAELLRDSWLTVVQWDSSLTLNSAEDVALD